MGCHASHRDVRPSVAVRVPLYQLLGSRIVARGTQKLPISAISPISAMSPSLGACHAIIKPVTHTFLQIGTTKSRTCGVRTSGGAGPPGNQRRESRCPTTPAGSPGPPRPAGTQCPRARPAAGWPGSAPTHCWTSAPHLHHRRPARLPCAHRRHVRRATTGARHEEHVFTAAFNSASGQASHRALGAEDVAGQSTRAASASNQQRPESPPLARKSCTHAFALPRAT